MPRPTALLLLLGFGLGLTACNKRTSRMASVGSAELPLAPVGYKILDWTTVEACSSYAFSFRVPQSGKQRFGYISRGAIIGGALRDPDSSEALFAAMESLENATHLLNPRFEVEVSGLTMFGSPIFGRRCSTVRVRGIAVESQPYGGGAQTVAAPPAAPAPDAEPTPSKTKQPSVDDWK